MDKSAYFIREQDVYLLWLDDRRYLTETEGRMRHRMPFMICARPIVRGAVFIRLAGARWRFAFFECGLYAASRAVYARDLTSLVQRDYHVPPFLAAWHA